MKIIAQCVVGLTWTLKDTLGEELDKLDEPVEFLLGGKDLLASIEEALLDHAGGDILELHLEPENAFGDYDENLVFLESRSIFPAELEEGMTFDGAAMPPGAASQAPPNHIYSVTEIYPEHVVLDGNHPLGGIAIRLALKVESVRKATEQEIKQGSLGTGFFRLEMSPPGSGLLH